MLFESEEWKMEPYSVELNTFVDTILHTMYQHCAHRPIVLSSFSPEVCILLSNKQRTFPVMFLNDAGNYSTDDIRASSLQQAVHFAKRWDLSGIVMASEPFVMCPKLAQYVKSLGLSCASYGSLNNDPKCARVS